jgi:Holliday junction resolvase
MSNYKRGRNFEYEVRDYYRALGYYVVRSANSKGLADLVALKKGEVLLIQCKLNGLIGSKERKEFVELAEKVGAKPIIAWKEHGKLRKR